VEEEKVVVKDCRHALMLPEVAGNNRSQSFLPLIVSSVCERPLILTCLQQGASKRNNPGQKLRYGADISGVHPRLQTASTLGES
jgi:hypothetical protein